MLFTQTNRNILYLPMRSYKPFDIYVNRQRRNKITPFFNRKLNISLINQESRQNLQNIETETTQMKFLAGYNPEKLVILFSTFEKLRLIITA